MHRGFCYLDTLFHFRRVRLENRGPIKLFPFVSWHCDTYAAVFLCGPAGGTLSTTMATGVWLVASIRPTFATFLDRPSAWHSSRCPLGPRSNGCDTVIRF